MAEKTTVARPYAEAIFALARSRDDLKGWSEMLQFAAGVASDPQMKALAGNPRVGDEKLADLFLDVCGDRLNAQGQNLIKVLVENRRLNLLPEIVSLYESYRADAEGTLRVEVITAYALDAEQQGQIAKALDKRLARTVSLTCVTDKALLGGVIIRAGDNVIDGSARGQLQRLASALAR